MTPDRIRLESCEACGTAYPAGERRCPECGALRPGGGGGEPAGSGTAPDVMPEEMEELFEAFGPLFGGRPASKRAAWSPMARMVLGRYLGCLTWALLLFFGVPLAVGALAGDALGGLAVMLLAVGVLGLGLTGWLVWLVKPTKRK